jgi:hypothetical protein
MVTLASDCWLCGRQLTISVKPEFADTSSYRHWVCEDCDTSWNTGEFFPAKRLPPEPQGSGDPA